MNVLRNQRVIKSLALIQLGALLLHIFLPYASYALGGGPKQPEFTMFEPVSSNDMVNEFTGDFTYNLPVVEIPGPNGSGYALSLSYHSGVTPEEEASWVGLGWTLNAGAITRQLRGIPDDMKGATTTYWNQRRDNWTGVIGGDLGVEAFSAGLGMNAHYRYNNYRGFSKVTSLTPGLLGISVTFNRENNYNSSWSVGINPVQTISGIAGYAGYAKNGINWDKAFTSSAPNYGKHYSKQAMSKLAGQSWGTISRGVMKGFTDWGFPSIAPELDSEEIYNWSVGGMVAPNVPVSGTIGTFGTYSIQRYRAECPKPAYGYLYAGVGQDNPLAVLDYYTEKDDNYNRRDKFLPAPFMSPDMFTVTGEGIGGSFRFHNKRPGFVRKPLYEHEANVSTSFGFEGNVGGVIGGGGDLGFGKHTMEVSTRGWMLSDIPEEHQQYFAKRHNDVERRYPTILSNQFVDEGVFARFSGDLGGNVLFGNNEEAQANVFYNFPPSFPNNMDLHYSLRNDDFSGKKLTGRSSFIGFHTNKEMNDVMDVNNDDVHFRAYNKDPEVEALVIRDEATIADGIGEYVVYNSNGTQYTYGLPVYSRNEKDLSFSVEGGTFNNGKDKIFKNVSSAAVKVGNERDQPYASAWLLTAITSPDYRDKDLDGPTDDDQGGWTRFRYKQWFGNPDKLAASTPTQPWYNWRVPYNGLSYDPYELSDPNDDLGSASGGEREVYYLEYIETKTHLAKITTSDRMDGIPANQNFESASASSNSHGTYTNKRLQKVEQIELFAKDENGQQGELLKTVHFEYDYSVCPNTPNNINFINGTPTNTGKLTLKRVWFEYNGIVEPEISPYQFEYSYDFYNEGHVDPAYPTDAYPKVAYPVEYAHLDNYGEDYVSTGTNFNNEPYDHRDIDGWGNFRDNELNQGNRSSKMQPWVDQANAHEYDAAMWHLKRIILPSRGEIHVQYEQDDYRFVGGHKAMAMVSIDEVAGALSETGTPEYNHCVAMGVKGYCNRYYLNLEEIGLTDQQEIEAYADELRAYFKVGDWVSESKEQKAYFKFLYKLIGQDWGNVNNNLELCNAEFIDGYVPVRLVEVDGTRIYIKLGDPEMEQQLEKERYSVPSQICDDYVMMNRVGNIREGLCSGFNPGAVLGTVNGPEDVPSLLNEIQQMGMNTIDNVATDGTRCRDLDPENSYVRLPIPKQKKGGGVRVKRLLRFDRGIEGPESSNLYGTEYIYELTNGLSSGVAQNEPNALKEENPFVDFLLKRKNIETPYKRAVAGIVREQFEGPYGYSVLPPASVGYSRVVTKSISPMAETSPGVTEIINKQSNPGFTVKRYFTDHDEKYRVAFDHSSVKEDKIKPVIIPIGPVGVNKHKFWKSQGYVVNRYNMHGQPKSVTTYEGNYENVHDMDRMVKSSEVKYQYYPIDSVPIQESVGAGIQFGPLGKEMDVVSEVKTIRDITRNGHVEADFSVGLPIPPTSGIYPSGGPTIQIEENELNTLVTTKVVSHTPVLKSVATYSNNTRSITVNETYDPQTGSVLVSRTNDEFDGLDLGEGGPHNGKVFKLNFPAFHEYGDMGSKVGEGYKFYSNNNLDDCDNYIDMVSGPGATRYLMIQSTDCGVCDIIAKFSVGDLVHVEQELLQPPSGPVSAGGSYLQGSSIPNIVSVEDAGIYHVKAIDGNQIELIHTGNYNNGPYVLDHVNVEILRSGKDNKLGSSVGSVTTYGQDIVDPLNHSNSFSFGPSESRLATILSNSDLTTSLNNTTVPNFPGKLEIENAAGVCHNINLMDISFQQQQNNPSNEVDITFQWEVVGTQNVFDCTNQISYDDGWEYTFGIDLDTRQLYFASDLDPCNRTYLSCFTFCGDQLTTIPGVVASAAQTFTDQWEAPMTYGLDLSETGKAGRVFNDFENGQLGSWRLKDAYVYRTDIRASNDLAGGERVHSGGVYDQFKVYNWEDELLNDATKWIKTEEVTKLSKDGNAIEANDLLNIRSSTKYGYHGSLPYLAGKNAEYSTVQFESFETHYSNGNCGNSPELEDCLGFSEVAGQIELDDQVAHAGSSSLKIIDGNTQPFTMKPITFDGKLLEGISVKLWKKGASVLEGQLLITPSSSAPAGMASQIALQFEEVARNGEWILMYANVKQEDLFNAGIPLTNPGSVETLTPVINIAPSNLPPGTAWPPGVPPPTVWIDDVQVKPKNAAVMAYVYDKDNHRLLTIFDDQNFGMYYQYNAQGQLTRKLMETERGMKTLDERFYHIPDQIDRPQ